MKDAQPKAVHLKDYRAPNFLIQQTQLEFDLRDDFTLVNSRLQMTCNPALTEVDAPLILHGQELELLALAIDGVSLEAEQYRVDGESLYIERVPNKFEFSCTTRIKPQENTSLEGLYRSRKMYCTQCEAEGFRKITYYLDRPDVMSEFSTKIIADKGRFPQLLSNGNLIESGDLDDGRHWVRWHDPFKNLPIYLPWSRVISSISMTTLLPSLAERYCCGYLSKKKTAINVLMRCVL